MKKSLYDDLKQRKPFFIYDVILYATIAIIVAALFLGFVIIPDNTDADGIKIFVDEKEVFVFRYASGDYEIKEFDGRIEKVEADGNFTFRIFPHGDGEYNVININPRERSAKITDANCSVGKDCVHTPEIKGGAGAIYCMPHKVKVLPIKSEYKRIETGGL